MCSPAWATLPRSVPTYVSWVMVWLTSAGACFGSLGSSALGADGLTPSSVRITFSLSA